MDEEDKLAKRFPNTDFSIKKESENIFKLIKGAEPPSEDSKVSEETKVPPGLARAFWIFDREVSKTDKTIQETILYRFELQMKKKAEKLLQLEPNQFLVSLFLLSMEQVEKSSPETHRKIRDEINFLASFATFLKQIK